MTKSRGDIHVFISHSCEDQELAGEMLQLIRACVGSVLNVRCTSLLSTQHPLGTDVPRALARDVQRCTAFVALITPAFMRSAYCIWELATAFNAEQRIFAVRWPGVRSEQLGPFKDIQMLFVNPDGSTRSIFRELVVQLTRQLRLAVADPSLMGESYERAEKVALAWAKKYDNASSEQIDILLTEIKRRSLDARVCQKYHDTMAGILDGAREPSARERVRKHRKIAARWHQILVLCMETRTNANASPNPERITAELESIRKFLNETENIESSLPVNHPLLDLCQAEVKQQLAQKARRT